MQVSFRHINELHFQATFNSLVRVPTPPGKVRDFFKIPGPEKSGKIVATRCHIRRLKCTKFDFGWGSTPDPTLGKLISLPQIPKLDLKGPISKWRKVEGGRVRTKGKGFSLYLSIRGLRKCRGKFLMGVLESPGFFLSVKEWEPWLVH